MNLAYLFLITINELKASKYIFYNINQGGSIVGSCSSTDKKIQGVR